MIDDISGSNLARKIGGHLWTIAPTVRHRIVPFRAPEARSWVRHFEADDMGQVRVSGLHRRRENSRRLVVIVHGLGGCQESAYVVQTARAVDEAGFSCLRLGMRGADREGPGFYHGGLTTDLHQALSDDAFADYEEIFVVGFSLGGHIALRAATESLDPRVTAVAAICSPLDLSAGQKSIDSPKKLVYREYILRELRDMYRNAARLGEVPTPVERIAKVRTLREWDSLTVVPRFGFGTVDNYYETASVSGRLDRLDRRALLVYTEHDPMIPAASIDSIVSRAPENLTVHRMPSGGHVFFPPRVDLGYEAPEKLIPQVLSWAADA